jgi:hypothetical protein
MSDFKVQYVTAQMSTAETSKTATLGTSIDTSKSFIMPAVTYNTGGWNQTTGGSSDAVNSAFATAVLTDSTTVTFTRDATNTQNCNCACYVVTYIGAAAGANEIIVRSSGTFTIAGTATSANNGADITTVSDVNDCVAFITTRYNQGLNHMYGATCTADITGSVGAYRVTANRASAASSTTTVSYFLVEFTGSNWGVQKVSHTYTASDTNQDDTITSVGAGLTHSFVYSTFRVTDSSNPAQCNYLVWLANTTTLRHRVKQYASGSVSISYVVTNSQMTVAQYNTPDGTQDWTGTAPTDVTVTTVGAEASTIINAGCDDTTSGSSLSSSLWRAYYVNTTTVSGDRSYNKTGTEYVLQTIDWTNIADAGVSPETLLLVPRRQLFVTRRIIQH